MESINVGLLVLVLALVIAAIFVARKVNTKLEVSEAEVKRLKEERNNLQIDLSTVSKAQEIKANQVKELESESHKSRTREVFYLALLHYVDKNLLKAITVKDETGNNYPAIRLVNNKSLQLEEERSYKALSYIGNTDFGDKICLTLPLAAFKGQKLGTPNISISDLIEKIKSGEEITYPNYMESQNILNS